MAVALNTRLWERVHSGTGRDGLDWTGLDWTGLDWTALRWIGSDVYTPFSFLFSVITPSTYCQYVRSPVCGWHGNGT